MSNKSFEELQRGQVNNQLTQDELALFLQLMQQDEYAEKIQEFIGELLVSRSFTVQVDEGKGDDIFQKIMSEAKIDEQALKAPVFPLKLKSTGFTFLKIAAAASLLGMIILSSIFFYNKGTEKHVVKTEIKIPYKNDPLPGGNKALLTLADGSTIVLDEAQDGPLAKQGNTQVIKVNGKLNYNAAGTATKEVLYNTISTPRGGQFQIELPDGSLVWLNAASSLQFPTAFVGKERKVEITGEAYFEIAK